MNLHNAPIGSIELSAFLGLTISIYRPLEIRLLGPLGTTSYTLYV